jgi:hypothetical protein
MRVAVGEFVHEQVVTDQQGGHHAAGGDEKWFIQEGMDAHRDKPGPEDRLEKFGSRAGFAFVP